MKTATLLLSSFIKPGHKSSSISIYYSIEEEKNISLKFQQIMLTLVQCN